MTEHIQEQITISEEYFGQRLDQVLAELLPQYSRNKIKAWIEEEKILLNHAPVKPKHKLLGNEIVSLNIELSPSYESNWQGEDIDLDIVHEDEHIIVLNKPAGLVVHPAAGNAQGTLVNALLHYLPELNTLPRAGIVHRLDKDTTGLMVVAKTLLAHNSLIKQLQARTVKREYLAVVQGYVISGGTVNQPIGRDQHHRQRMAVNPMGKPAVTHLRVLERFRAHTLVKAVLETGRTHQIRVHAAYMGFPVFGDQTYGRIRIPPKTDEQLIELLRSFKRQALHAHKLGLIHPDSGKKMEWQVPMPNDMQQLIDALRADNEDIEEYNMMEEEYWEDEDFDEDN